jgi:glycine/D-amino acid oxidase-like deaminating enzyme
VVGVEWLDPSDINRRWPQISTQGIGPAVYEPHAGVLDPRLAVERQACGPQPFEQY